MNILENGTCSYCGADAPDDWFRLGWVYTIRHREDGDYDSMRCLTCQSKPLTKEILIKFKEASNKLKNESRIT